MQWRVTKLEATTATAATREDFSRLEVMGHREILGIQRDISGIHEALHLSTRPYLRKPGRFFQP